MGIDEKPKEEVSLGLVFIEELGESFLMLILGGGGQLG